MKLLTESKLKVRPIKNSNVMHPLALHLLKKIPDYLQQELDYSSKQKPVNQMGIKKLSISQNLVSTRHKTPL